MLKSLIIFLTIVITIPTPATDHGIYFQTHKNINGNIETIKSTVKQLIEKAGFTILADLDVAVPDLVRENPKEHSGYKAKLLVFTSDEYVKQLTSFGNKYVVAGFLRVGLYETADGIQIVIADPETINRIIFNDLWENDKIEEYSKIAMKSKTLKSKIVSTIHKFDGGVKVEEPKSPIRDEEDLRESSRDMFMMVGPMTFFTDEDQFPMIYSRTNKDGKKGLANFKKEVLANIKNFKPTAEDVEYRYTSSPEILKWRVVSEIYSPDSTAILLGLTRSRTEALSFHIAGASREEDDLLTPGIDHVCAYPIEVLIMNLDKQLKVYTPREMFRMDMYFWDAGMAAFMDHMSMPSILDESIKRALLGKEYKD